MRIRSKLMYNQQESEAFGSRSSELHPSSVSKADQRNHSPSCWGKEFLWSQSKDPHSSVACSCQCQRATLFITASDGPTESVWGDPANEKVLEALDSNLCCLQSCMWVTLGTAWDKVKAKAEPGEPWNIEYTPSRDTDPPAEGGRVTDARDLSTASAQIIDLAMQAQKCQLGNSG